VVAHIKRKIAFIEDSPDTADLFTEFLNRLCDNLDVSHFFTGPAFLQHLQPGIYPLAIVDISLPEMDGYELLKRMHAVDPHITAVAFTAHIGDRYRQKAIDAGFHSVVTKPVLDMDAFCQRMIDLVDEST
jgi:CheY-like chemotaxis protein